MNRSLAYLKDTGMTFNNCSAMNETYHQVEASVSMFFVLIYSLMFVVGLILNGFTMKFYFCQTQQQASSGLKVYLKNLSTADFLLCLSLPLRISNYTSSSVIIHQVFCSFGASLFFLNMYTSILFMGYIAANRYLRIIHPSGTHILQTVRAAYIISRATWVCLLGPAVTYAIAFIITQTPQTLNRCAPDFSESFRLFFKIIQTSCIIIFLLVLISLVFFYYSISRRVSLAQPSQLASSGSKKLVKSRRNMLMLVSIFCLCFVPYHLVRIPFTFLLGNCSVGHVLYYAMDAATTMSALNVCLDPLVYFFLCKAFRAQVKRSSRRSRINIQQSKRESDSSREEQESSWNHHLNSKVSNL